MLKLYYKRNSYDATWYNYDGTVLTTTTFKYGQTITAPEAAATRTGYTWGGWNIETVTMGASGASFNATDHGTWTANTYTVTFNANGGTGTMDVQTFTYDVSGRLTVNAFTRSGYTFAGWSKEAAGEVVYADEAEVTNLAASGNVDLYAQWSDGSAGYKVEHYGESLDGTDYVLIETENLSATTGTTVNAFDRDLAGFTYDSSNSGNDTSGTVAADGSLVLKLYYTRNSYTLTLNFGEESITAMTEQKYTSDGITDTETVLDHPELQKSYTEITLKYGASLAEVLNADYEVSIFTGIEDVWDDEGNWTGYEDVYETASLKTAFTGYTFDGWDNSDTTMPASDLTLTAQWTPVPVTITLNPGTNYSSYDGEQVSGEPIVVPANYGETVDLAAYGYTHDGYFMVGWNYNSTMVSGAEITGDLVLVDGYYNYNSGYSVSDGALDLYAFWIDEDSMCTITFDPNCTDYSGTMSDQIVSYGDGLWVSLYKNQFTREGYRFIGWSTTENYQSGTDTLYDDRAGLTWESATVTLYAQWELITG